MALLEIDNLVASIGETEVLRGLSLKVEAGEVHAIMGPNGAGKSTLSKIIAGHPDYTVKSGDIRLGGETLLNKSPDERAALGVFLGFQDPVEIPGVNNLYFLRTALNAQRRRRGEAEIDAPSFLRLAKDEAARVGLDAGLIKRALNDGFSGGERKRNEMLQLAVLQPKLAILDEIDSGLDIDALAAVAQNAARLRAEGMSFLLVTHYNRLLDAFPPDIVHVLVGGRIVHSGPAALAKELETSGYHAWSQLEVQSGAAQAPSLHV